MLATGDNAPFIQHQDQIGPLHRAQAVGNDKGGAPVHHPLQSQLDQMLCLGIHAGGGIIEDQNARVGQQGAGNCQALLLPAGKRHPALAHLRIVAIWGLHDKIVRLGGLAACLDFCLGGLWFAKGDILADRSREEGCLLQHHADLAAQRIDGHASGCRCHRW